MILSVKFIIYFLLIKDQVQIKTLILDLLLFSVYL